MIVTPHVALKSRHSAIDGRTTRHPDYAQSQRRRKKIEEPFSWIKAVGGMAQTLYRGIECVWARFTLAMAACSLAKLPKLLATWAGKYLLALPVRTPGCIERCPRETLPQ